MNFKKNLLFLPLVFAGIAFAEPRAADSNQIASIPTEQVSTLDSTNVSEAHEKAITEKDIEPITSNLQELQASSEALKQEIETLKATIQA